MDDLDVSPTAATDAPDRRPRVDGGHARPGAGRWTIGPALLVLGAALAWVATGGMTDWSIVWRLLVGAASVVALYRGIDALLGPRVDTTLWLAGLWLVVIVGAALLAPVLPLGEHEDTAATLLEPGFVRPDLLSEHPLGTNNFGLDLLARVIWGARTSLITSVSAAFLGIAIGAAIGMIAGFYRGRVDGGIGILTDVVLSFPPLILLIALATVLERNVVNTAIGLAIIGIPTNVRLARANTLVFAQREFVLSARAMGARNRRLIFRELLPNVLMPMVSYAFIIIAVLIVAEASISFLGLGLQPPQPTWGNMIAEGNSGVFEAHPHVVLVPGVVMFLTVFGFNLFGERARSRFEGRDDES